MKQTVLLDQAPALGDAVAGHLGDLSGQEVPSCLPISLAEHIPVVTIGRTLRSDAVRHAQDVGSIPALMQPHAGSKLRIAAVLWPKPQQSLVRDSYEVVLAGGTAGSARPFFSQQVPRGGALPTSTMPRAT